MGRGGLRAVIKTEERQSFRALLHMSACKLRFQKAEGIRLSLHILYVSAYESLLVGALQLIQRDQLSGKKKRAEPHIIIIYKQYTDNV